MRLSENIDFGVEIQAEWQALRRRAVLLEIQRAKNSNDHEALFSGDEMFVFLPHNSELVGKPWLPPETFTEMVAALGLRLDIVHPRQRLRRWWNVFHWLARVDRSVVYRVTGWHTQGPPEPTTTKGPVGPFCFAVDLVRRIFPGR